jgi:hypothetical protein
MIIKYTIVFTSMWFFKDSPKCYKYEPCTFVPRSLTNAHA